MRFPREVLEILKNGINEDICAPELIDISQNDTSNILEQNLSHVLREQEEKEIKEAPNSALVFSKFLGTLSGSISQAARKMLPDTWEFNEGRVLNLSSLKSKWVNGSEGCRLELCRMICSDLNPKKNSLGEKDSSRTNDTFKKQDTSIDRVLPLRYGRWIKEKGIENPHNCLAKYQMLVSIGEFFNVPMLSVTTLVGHYKVKNDACYKMARDILSFFERHNLPLSEERKSKIQRIASYIEHTRKSEEIQHFSVAFRSSEDRWIVIDPNMGMTSLAPENWALEECYEKIKIRKTFSPLFSYQKRCDEVSTICNDSINKFNEKLQDLEEHIGVVKDQGEYFIYKQLKQPWDDLEADFSVQKNMAILQHPAVEISDAGLRMASATLSHVCYEVSEDYGNQIEQILFALGIVQGHLYNVASSVLRNPSLDREFSDLAFSVLERLPVLSVMNEGLLKRKNYADY